MNNRIQLGSITAPSGNIAVMDMGYAGLWCPTESSFLDDSNWPLDDEQCEFFRTSVDMQITGPDAMQAGKLFDRQWHPEWLYDIPRHGVDDVRKSFSELTSSQNLRASLAALPHRIPHPSRANKAMKYGNEAGEFIIQGIPVIVFDNIQSDKSFPVFADPMVAKEFEGYWRRIYIELLKNEPIGKSTVIGKVGVDWARLIFADITALAKWQHNDSIDGLCDYVFWGRDEEAVAKLLQIGKADPHSYGWTNISIDQAIENIDKIEHILETTDNYVATDFRPHSHHWQVMQQVRNSEYDSGTIDIDGITVCGFMTSWGDGLFDVIGEYNDKRQLARIVIDVGNASIANRLTSDI